MELLGNINVDFDVLDQLPVRFSAFYPHKLALNFADKWRSLSRYISLAD
jgi:hypothetical protein